MSKSLTCDSKNKPIKKIPPKKPKIKKVPSKSAASQSASSSVGNQSVEKNIKKIISGKNITVFIDNQPKMFVGGDSNNDYFFQFLKNCDDKNKLNLVLSNRTYENYIKTYNEFPVNQEIFEHGHKIAYLVTNNTFKITVNHNTEQYAEILALKLLKINDAIVPYASFSQKEAIQIFDEKNDGFEPSKLIKFCSKCLSLYSIEDLSTKKTNLFSQEKIVNV